MTHDHLAVFSTFDLSLEVNQINSAHGLWSMTMQLPMTCSSCIAFYRIIDNTWKAGMKSDDDGSHKPDDAWCGYLQKFTGETYLNATVSGMKVLVLINVVLIRGKR